MLAKSRSNDPVSKVDPKPYVEYIGIQEDFVIYNDMKALIKSEGIKHIDNKLVPAALLAMGDFVAKRRVIVPGRVGLHMCYFGVKLTSMLGAHNSSYFPERDYGSFSNREAAKRPREPDGDDESDSD